MPGVLSVSYSYVPVAAPFPKLLLKVTQGETVALHGSPVRNLLTTEEIRHHRLPPAAPGRVS